MKSCVAVTKSLEATNIWFVSMGKLYKKEIMFFKFRIQANNVCIVTQISDSPSSYIQAFIKYHNGNATSFTLNLPYKLHPFLSY
jgi:hypothetical protein